MTYHTLLLHTIHISSFLQYSIMSILCPLESALPSLGVGERRGQLACPPKLTDALPVTRLPAGWLVACGESGGSGAAAA